MKSSMSMSLDTPWGNRVDLVVEAELDNGHAIQSSEIARMQVDTLAMMVNEVRVQNERELDVMQSTADPPPQPDT